MRNVFIRGDTHGDFDFLPYFCEKEHTTTEDLMIILGDAGINYYGKKSKREIALKEMLSKMPITLFCIRGNHEDRPTSRQNTMKYGHRSEVEGEELYYEEAYPNILYAADGGSYVINDKQFLTIGGAYSVDKFYRLMNGWKWVPDEMLSAEEQAILYSHLRGKSFDYVLTHTCPIDWEPTDLFIQGLDQSEIPKDMENFLQAIEQEINYEHWYFGHYHADRENVAGNPKVHMLFNKIERLL